MTDTPGNGSSGTPAGWYPDQRGNMRWWDGSAWTDNVQQGASSPGVPQAPLDAKAKKPWYKKKLWWAAAAVVVIIAASASAGGGDEPSKATPSVASDSNTTKSDEPAAEEEPAPEEEPVAEEEPVEETEPAAAEEPELTAGQENAIGSAEDYLAFAAFSRSGLIEQLEFEGFSAKDATFAVMHIEVDWNEQAAKSAKEYLDMSSFSRSALIEQLVFEGFTRSQAEYGVNKAY